MQQLSMLDLMAAPAPVAAKPIKLDKPHKKSAWEIQRDQLEAERAVYRRAMPADREGYVTLYSMLLADYHRAAVADDMDEQRRVANQLHSMADELFNRTLDGGDPFQSRRDGHYCWYDAATWLAQQTAAEDWQEPMFGQMGRIEIDIDGCRVDFRYEGIFAVCGGSARPLDDSKPFISETGYHSFQVSPHDYILCTEGKTFTQWMTNAVRAQLTSGGKSKLKLHKPPFGLKSLNTQVMAAA